MVKIGFHVKCLSCHVCCFLTPISYSGGNAESECRVFMGDIKGYFKVYRLGVVGGHGSIMVYTGDAGFHGG